MDVFYHVRSYYLHALLIITLQKNNAFQIFEVDSLMTIKLDISAYYFWVLLNGNFKKIPR